MNQQQQATPAPRILRGIQIGVVVGDKRDKTCTVQIEYMFVHPKYGKRVKRRTKFHVHDPQNSAKTGDQVQIAHCRPISKTKSWRLLRVVKAAPEAAPATVAAN
jgi:small subunit ribosomal protein S17